MVLPCFESGLRFIGFQYQKLNTNSIETGQTAWMYRLAWLYAGGKGCKKI
jgi:hypothetical protein